MQIDRRAFLRWTTGAAAWLLGWRGAARAWSLASGEAAPVPVAAPTVTATTAAVARESALGIHRATRNTRLGAIGTRLRAAREALTPWKAYPDVVRVALPAPVWDGGRALFAPPRADADAFTDRPLTRAELSRLLYLANGITDRSGGHLRRSAPSAGALYAGEVYVAVERVEGVAPGVYYYGVRGHSLAPVRAGRVFEELAAALENAAEARNAAAAVLLTNVFARYCVRYANRGYRYALIDSGHIGENLRLAAAELGLRERSQPRWEDDRLNALLGVDGRGEAVCALHLLGRPAHAGAGSASHSTSAPAEPRTPNKRLVERQWGEPASLPVGLSATEAYHEATKLVAVASRDAAGHGPSAQAHLGAPDGGPSDRGAEDREAPDTPVHRAIRVRRSARRFERAALPRESLMRILAFARGIPASTRRALVPDLDLDVVAHRVAGLAAGVYRYDATARTLVPRRRGELSEELIEVCLGQRKSGQASAALIGVAQLAASSERDGARAYRHLLLEAGAVAQRIYLGAEAHGLAARNLAAYYDDALDALLGLDGRTEVAVHLTALGPGD